MVQYTAIKAGNADAAVIALSTMRIANSSSCSDRTQLSPELGPAGWDPAFCKVCWLQQVLGNMTQPASRFFDALSWHPYRLGTGDPGPEAFLPGPPGASGNSSVREEMGAVRAEFGDGKPLFMACTARPRTRGVSRRRQPLGVAMAGRLRPRIVECGALAARSVAS